MWSVSRASRTGHRVHLSIEALTPRNLYDIRPLWPDRDACTGDELSAALNAGRCLLATERAQGAVVRLDGRPVGIVLTVFATDDFSAGYVAAPFPHLGRFLLLSLHQPDCPILDADRIGSGNAGCGLNLFALATHIARDLQDRLPVLATLMRAFMEVHRGFQVKRIVSEVFGEADIEDVRAFGSFDTLAEFGPEHTGILVPSLVATLTREQAAARRAGLLPMFSYNRPLIGFPAAERALLRAALDGETDERLSRQLGLTVAAVKARWSRTNDRVLRRKPELFADVPTATASNRRGPQVRHIVLRYLRANPSELVPYRLPTTRPLTPRARALAHSRGSFALGSSRERRP